MYDSNANQPADPPLTPTLRTFIVEDSPVIRENLVATLEEILPLEVVGTAENEVAAVAWLADLRNGCELAIIDVFLKKGTGIGVLKSLRRIERPLKLVVLTNFATPDIRRTCLALGADRVFDKSHDIDALLRYCARLAAGDAADSVPAAIDAV